MEVKLQLRRGMFFSYFSVCPRDARSSGVTITRRRSVRCHDHRLLHATQLFASCDGQWIRHYFQRRSYTRRTPRSSVVTGGLRRCETPLRRRPRRRLGCTMPSSDILYEASFRRVFGGKRWKQREGRGRGLLLDRNSAVRGEGSGPFRQIESFNPS